MKHEDVKKGMKVVPLSKTAPGWTGLDGSYSWQVALKKKCPFLYVHYFDEEEQAWVLGHKKGSMTGGDFFRASDFRPYEPPV